MITSMKVLSQALAAAGILISISQEENFLAIVKELSISPPSQEDLEVSFEKTNESCTIINEGYPLELENEKFLTCLLADPECDQGTTHPMENNQHDMEEEDEQHGPNQEMDQEYHDHIEHWFRTMTKAREYSSLLKLLLSYQVHWLVLHAHVHFQVCMINLSMNIYFHLIRTWLHWKYSYT